MLRGTDAVLEVLGYALVVFFVIMLFAGPQVIAEDKPDQEDAAAAAAARDGGGAADQGGGAADQGGGEADQGGGEADQGDGEAAPAADGQAVFTDNCGSCHTLSAAGTSGSTGPNLDDVSLDAGAIEGIVRDGRGGMPSFDGKLSDDEIAAVAAFVAGD
jgi:mono/diheme cytochrome c family protein